MNSLTNCAQEIRQPLIGCEYSDLDHAVEALAQSVDRLLSRVDPMLMPSQPQQPTKSVPVPDVPLPAFGARLRDTRRQLVALNERVNDANQRIEI